MAKESSFDVVSTVDMQEVDNAYGQAKREIAQRYDLKDSGAEITLDKGGRKLTVAAPAEFVAKQVIDVIGSKLIKRGVDLSAVKWGDIVPAAGQSVRRTAEIIEGIDKETETKLFSPFFSTKPNGQGIGLIFIREVLLKHDCRFSLRSYADGLTRFKIWFS